MYEEALAEAESAYTVIGFSQAAEALALGYEEAGYRGAMKRAGETWEALSEVMYVPSVEMALVHAFAGEDSKSLDCLERAFEEHDPNMPYLNGMPWFNSSRADPRFQDLLRRMNLPH